MVLLVALVGCVDDDDDDVEERDEIGDDDDDDETAGCGFLLAFSLLSFIRTTKSFLF